jgi:glutamate N-acetyltransferase/amino-acid N-acetyltransferase
VAFDPDRVRVAYGDTVICRDGIPADHDTEAVQAHMAGDRLDITADLGLGTGEGAILTNDLTHAYIDENMGTS